MQPLISTSLEATIFRLREPDRVDLRILTRRLIRLTIIGAAALAQSGLMAQATPVALQAPLQPAFEIVSIHLVKQDDIRPEHIDNPFRRGYLKASNVNLKSLMEIAYDIPDLRMLGGPTWLTSERFSLEARADLRIDEQLATVPIEQAKLVKQKMIAALLVERFALAVHTDKKEMFVYAMVVGKGGPQLAGTRHGDDSQSAGD